MKKLIRILSIMLVSILVILYLAFLFVLPNVVDLNQFKPEIQKIAKEQANLIVDFNNPKISVTPLLSAGITADNISVKLLDGSDILTTDSFKGRIALPSLLLLTVKVSTAELNNPVINIDIVDGKAFKAVQAFEEILNKNEEHIEENLQTAQKPIIDPAMIKILVPAVKINNYTARINDLQSGNYLKLRGDELVLGYKNGKTASIKTLAELYINETKNITANIDIDTFLPPQSVLDEEDDKAQRVDIPFINPVTMYMEYDLKTNVDSKIKVRQKNNRIVSKGHFYVDDFTLNLAGLQLPESKLHIDTKGTKVDIDSDLFITNEEKISINGMFNYGRQPRLHAGNTLSEVVNNTVNFTQRPKMDLNITSNKIYINDVLTLIKATMNALHIKNELQPIKGDGYFISNIYIKTNFKRLKSSGNITIKDCIINNIKNKITLARINSVISLDNNMLKFIDTTAEVADTIFKIDGTIEENSNTDLHLFMEKMPIERIFNLFLPSEINNIYAVNSGYINLSANIKGKLKEAAANINLTANNLALTDKINKIKYYNNLFTANFNSDFETFTGDINNSNLRVSLNGSNIDCEKFQINIGEKDITISPSTIKIDNSTIINFNGKIKDYQRNPIFNFFADGNLITKDLKKVLGNDLSIYFKNAGALPLKISLTGDNKKQTLEAAIDANKDNYITPVEISNVLNQNTTIKTTIDFKGDRLKIKDTGFYIVKTSQNPEDPEKTITTYEEVASIDGTITKLNTQEPNINLIKVKIPKDLSASICLFPKSELKAKGNLLIFGALASPRIRGEFNIWDMSIPELLTTMQNASAKFEGKDLNVDINKLIANGSDYNITMNADLNPSTNFVIKNLNLMSDLTDADKLMPVSDAAIKYTTPPSQGNTITKNDTQAADIPVIIKDGTINIKQIKTGDMTLVNTTGNIALENNIIYINNILTNVFKGKIRGDVSMNLISSEIKAILKGSGLDVEQTLLEAVAMKDTLSGTMDFDTNISLKGSTYEEQMESLKGEVNFIMKNGCLGPFGKIENLILAENIRESAFFQSTIGSILNSMLSFDTTKFSELKGNLTFDKGIANINSISSKGDIMSTYIFGNFDLLKNTINIKLRGRLGSQVSESMGPLALLNPINLVKATPGMSLILGKIFFLFCESVTPDELNKIPDLDKNISENNATKFQVIIRGDVAKPLTLVKSFKWLALQSEIDSAKSYVNTIPQGTLPAEITGIDLTNLNKDEIKTQVKETTKKKVKEAVSNSLTDEQKEAIEQNKETANKLKSLFGSKEKAKETLQQAKEDALKQLQEQVQSQLQTENKE